MNKFYVENLFVEFNAKYFYGAIPHIRIAYGKKHIPEWGRFENDIVMGNRIVLSPILKNYQMALEGVLLHEMIHAWQCHRFKGMPNDRAYLWLEHTDDFLELENKLNRKHFKLAKGHDKYFRMMLADLKNKRVVIA
jgi:hypothetical protein